MTLFKTINPEPLKVGPVRLGLLNQLRKVGRLVRKDFQATTATWKKQPEFDISISLAGGGATVIVTTDDQNYQRIDKGTEDHFVEAVNKKAIAFQSTFIPKTQTGFIGSGPGASGGETIIVKWALVSGIKARKFEDTITEKWDTQFAIMMQEELDRLMIQSRHSI